MGDQIAPCVHRSSLECVHVCAHGSDHACKTIHPVFGGFYIEPSICFCVNRDHGLLLPPEGGKVIVSQACDIASE